VAAELLTWNEGPGHRPRRLTDLLEDTDRPAVAALQEVHDWSHDVKGYDRLAAPSHTYPDREARSTVLLVRRKGVRLLRYGFRDVGGRGWWWNGGVWHPPRVFPWARLEVDGLGPLAVIGVHRVPGGPVPGIARNAPEWRREHRALVQWHRHRPRVPTVALGDWNDRKSTEAPRSVSALADQVGGTLSLEGIDGAIVRGLRVATTELPSRYGSDGHHPVLVHLSR